MAQTSISHCHFISNTIADALSFNHYYSVNIQFYSVL